MIPNHTSKELFRLVRYSNHGIPREAWNTLIFIGLVLVFAALALVFGPCVALGALFLWPKDLPH